MARRQHHPREALARLPDWSSRVELHLTEAFEQSRAETRHHSRTEAAAALLLLIGSTSMLPKLTASSDNARARLVARTVSSYWAMRMMTATRESVDPSEPIRAAQAIDGSLLRAAVNENAHAFNTERIELSQDAANEAWAPDIEQVWVAVLDGVTCASCKSHDGDRAPLHGYLYEGGPPIHPFCRCFIEYERRSLPIAA